MNCYQFIEAEKAQQRSVKRACELLKVSRAAFYQHLAARPRALRPTRISPARSGPCIRNPRAATALRGCTPSCVTWDAGTAASASPG